MNKSLLSGIFITLLFSSGIVYAQESTIIPPTRSFERVTTSNGTVTAYNYSAPLNLIGNGVTITGSQSQQKVYFAVTGGSGLTKIQGSNLGVHGSGFFGGNFNSSMLQFYSLLSSNPTCVISSNSTNIILTCNPVGGVTSLNFTTNGDFDFNILPRNMTNISLIGQVFNFILKSNIILTNGTAQIITKPLTLVQGILGGDLNVGSNSLVNGGHKSTLPLTSGTLCQTNGTCGQVTINANTGNTFTIQNVTINGNDGQKVTITNVTDTNTAQGLNLTSTHGYGIGVFTGRHNATQLMFKTLTCGGIISCSANSTNVKINATSSSSSNSTIPDSIVVYPYSTTLTDYTTPLSATASSNK